MPGYVRVGWGQLEINLWGKSREEIESPSITRWNQAITRRFRRKWIWGTGTTLRPVETTGCSPQTRRNSDWAGPGLPRLHKQEVTGSRCSKGLKATGIWSSPQGAHGPGLLRLLSPGRTLPGSGDRWEEGFGPAFREGAEASPAQTAAKAEGPWQGHHVNGGSLEAVSSELDLLRLHSYSSLSLTVLEYTSSAPSELTARFPLTYDTDAHLGACCGLSCLLPSDSDVGALIHYVDCTGPLWRWSGLDEAVQVGLWSCSALVRRERDTRSLPTLPQTGVGTVRRQPSASQGEGPRTNQPSWHLDLRLPASRTMRKIILLFTPPACGALSWQPAPTDRGPWSQLPAPCPTFSLKPDHFGLLVQTTCSLCSPTHRLPLKTVDPS